MKGPRCMECGGESRLVYGDVVYPHREDLRFRRYWLCDCGAYCGCHGNSTMALGSPAGPVTRSARKKAHEAFDPIWKSGLCSRHFAYRWLAKEMNITQEECHIGLFTAKQAEDVLRLCAERAAA